MKDPVTYSMGAMKYSKNGRSDEIMQRFGSRPALINAAKLADYFGDAQPSKIEGSVAVIDVVGPLSNETWSWGGTTYGAIQQQIECAENDPKVKGILLNVNSPGGLCDNAFETAAMISECVKPVYGVAATMAYSAAYLLLSQCDRVYCSPTSGGAGSIGVYAAHTDISGMLKQSGVAVTLISAGKGKTDGNPYEPLSDTARIDMQMEIDRLYGEFVGYVARGRGLDPTAIVKFGARCFDGASAAIAAGLVDMPGDIEDAWDDLETEISRAEMPRRMPGMTAKKNSAASAARKEPNHMAETNAAEPKTPTPAEIDAMMAVARSEGSAARNVEIENVNALCALGGKPALFAEFLGGKKTSAQIREELMAARVNAEAATQLNTGIIPGTDANADGKSLGKAKDWGVVMKDIKGGKN